MIPLAHVRQEQNGAWDKQPLVEHLTAVARMAGEFAGEFGSAEWGHLAGMLHDLGKVSPSWQAYLQKNSGYDAGKPLHIGGASGGRGNHSEAGAAIGLMDLLQSKRFSSSLSCVPLGLAYAIAGHHAGLADWDGDGEASLSMRLHDALEEWGRLNMESRLGTQPEKIDFAPELLHCSEPLPDNFMNIPPSSAKDARASFHLWARMLFSCLIDADFLDTEAFMAPERSGQRGCRAELSEIGKAFRQFMERLTANAPGTTVNRCRAEILGNCLDAAELEPGLFSLTAPTGGGKTFASFAFALKHAALWNKRRIIFAIPYTSIIEQTAKDLKNAVGPDLAAGILEHHSNIDPARETDDPAGASRARLAAENWDSPVIVTTNVQLFESLFSSRVSRCRKLHNIAGSVILLDEAQMLPHGNLQAILSAIKNLAKYFGVTVVLCTATQPTLSGTIGTGTAAFQGLPSAREIVKDIPRMFATLQRVHRVPRYDLSQPISWETLAGDLAAEPRVLAVVNRRKDCRDLYDELAGVARKNLFHLSALMCPKHRSERIAEIKRLLKETDEDVRVVSTQLIEAGVDIDFPAVYRAACGLDSAVQAAGRCNREGKMDGLGRFYLFTPPSEVPPGSLSKAKDAFWSLLLQNENLNVFDRDSIARFFRGYYGLINDFDEGRFKERMLDGALEFRFYFRKFDSDFSIIDSDGSVPVFTVYQNEATGADGQELIEQLIHAGRYGFPDRALLRRLQQYSVNIPRADAGKLLDKGLIAAACDGAFYYQTLPELYSAEYGLDLTFAKNSGVNISFIL